MSELSHQEISGQIATLLKAIVAFHMDRNVTSFASTKDGSSRVRTDYKLDITTNGEQLKLSVTDAPTYDYNGAKLNRLTPTSELRAIQKSVGGVINDETLSLSRSWGIDQQTLTSLQDNYINLAEHRAKAMLEPHRIKANVIRQPSQFWTKTKQDEILESGEKTGVPRDTTSQLLLLFAPIGEREAHSKVVALLDARLAEMKRLGG
jgi:hypothetical protein